MASFTRWLTPACLPIIIFGAGTGQAEQPDESGSPENTPGEIVVYGQRQEDFFVGILAEDELGENDIAAYGFDNVGELIGEIAREIEGDAEGPVILINGQIASGLSEVSDLPTEAVSKIQVLPRGAGTRVGQSASRRVINVVIKPNLRQFTTNANTRLTTRGDALAADGEINFLRLREGNRATLALRARHANPLLESQRDIISDSTVTPFDFIGNIVAFGQPGSEIDPLLSALTGSTVVVAGVPAGAAVPTLNDIARSANARNYSDFGRFRTLSDEQESYSANGNITHRLDPDTTASLNARIEHTTGRSLTGAGTALFEIPFGSRFSPFSRDVAIARAFGDPLTQNTRSTGATISETLNTRVGKYSLSLLATYNHRASRIVSDRDYDTSSLQDAIVGGTKNPFAAIEQTTLGPARSDTSRSRSHNGQLQAIANGPLVDLPAGSATFSAKLALRLDRLSSRTVGRTVNIARSLERTEKAAQLGMSLPLLGPTFGGPLGGLTFDVSAAIREISAAPTLFDYNAALSWDPIETLNVRGSWAVEETAPPSSAINDPVVVVESFRTFDFVRQETVLVRYLTGGNAALPTHRQKRANIGATLRPLGKRGPTFNAEYERRIGRNVFAALPPADARVQLAFPDRYIRDANGVLIQLDARPITYERDRSELVRWGIDFRRTFGGTVSVSEAEGSDREPVANQPAVSAGRGWRVTLNADHTWHLENTRLIRRGLPIIDLLSGGAVGFSGGQPTHVFQLSSALYHAGVGFNVNGEYRSGSTVEAGTLTAPDPIHFAARAVINTRLFINLGPQFPQSGLAKGTRVSLAVGNILDSKFRVTDSLGSTPLRYQPFLIDPLGRTVTFSLRKVL